MTKTPLRLLGAALLLTAASCTDDAPADPIADAGSDTEVSVADTDAGDAPAGSGDTAADIAGDSVPDVPVTQTICEQLELPVRAFDAEGPYGSLRHDRAADFAVSLEDGTAWRLADAWTGCDSYIVLPDTLTVSDVDGTSLWIEGVAGLIEASPLNVHYLFVSRRANDEQASANTAALQASIEAHLATLPEPEAAHWADRLHVVAGRAATLDAWIGSALQQGIGQLGLTIDRFQNVRAVGSLADVTRYDASMEWPWNRNIAYAANEARYYNYEAGLQDRLDADGALEVHLWQGEVLEQFEDIELELPTAEEMAQYDTLTFEFRQRCPNPNALEAGNCGAWDYLAHLWLYEGEGEDETRIELARHITTYHREGHWAVDITPALYLLRDGGTRHLRWEWAPEWNVQPTATWATLRFSNQGVGERPIALTELWTGRGFNAAYNDDRSIANVEIPAEATRVELRAIITGHGAETNQCAEFCNHQHEFIVEGRSFYQEHPAVGNQQGCLEMVDEGVVPNQWGTWWFGRGGWCPGQEVTPMIVDVTDLATPGETLSVDYFGWFEGRTPPDGSGNIVLTSYVVSYGE